MSIENPTNLSEYLAKDWEWYKTTEYYKGMKLTLITAGATPEQVEQIIRPIFSTAFEQGWFNCRFHLS